MSGFGGTSVKTALVTGSGGFVGRHMVKLLQKRGWIVRECDTNPSSRFLIGNDARHVLRAYETQTRFDLIVHCAYRVGGRATIDGDGSALAWNLSLDAALFNLAMRRGAGHIIYFSSSAVYQAWQQGRYSDPVGLRESLHTYADEADADYGLAKVVGERMATRAAEAGHLVTVVRPFSGYGTDQSADYPFNSLVRRAIASDEIEVWGSRHQVRDFIHIDDICRSTLAIAETNTNATPVNLCTGVGTTMAELIAQAREVAGIDRPYRIIENFDKPQGVFRRVGDPTLFQTYYQELSVPTLRDGIRKALGEDAEA